jgi:transketolase
MNHSPRPSLETLKAKAARCRIEILKMLAEAESGHPGGSLSAIDLIAALFFSEMNLPTGKAEDPDRDRFVLSKGHGVPALYAVFADLGWIPHEELSTLRKLNSRLQGHPDRHLLPMVEASTGSLGQGLSIAQGLAMAYKLQGKNTRVFCLLGDGEMQEGQVWETILSAPKFELNNLVAIVDGNNGQIDGYVEDVMNLNPHADKWRAFRWAVHEVDGHDFNSIFAALDATRKETSRPSVLLAKTVKGKGVSFMENNLKWHGSAPSWDQTKQAIEEIQKRDLEGVR